MLQGITPKVYEVELFTWMKEIKDSSTGVTYLELGDMKDMPNVLLVTKKGGNGGAVMFCLIHRRAFQMQGKCEECRNAVVTVADEACVTSCDTPEI
jgi:hypothetical protein